MSRLSKFEPTFNARFNSSFNTYDGREEPKE